MSCDFDLCLAAVSLALEKLGENPLEFNRVILPYYVLHCHNGKTDCQDVLYISNI